MTVKKPKIKATENKAGVVEKKKVNRLVLLEELHGRMKNVTILQQQLRETQMRINEISNILDLDENGK